MFLLVGPHYKGPIMKLTPAECCV